MSKIPQGSSAKTQDFTAKARWKHPELFDAGFVSVPTHFLELYSKLNPPLTSGEALFIIQLMDFKWTKAAPFPSYNTLAKRMGLSDKAVRRHAATLESKRYLQRIQRVGATNQFDLSKLFDALATAKEKHRKQTDVNGGDENDF